MSSENMIRDSIRSRFSTILSEDNNDLEAILLVLQMIRTDQETQYREISQKLDHFLSIQHKPASAIKSKKTKKNTNSAMEYFLATYAENQTAYGKLLDVTAIAALLDEYEDYHKDLEGSELIAKHAELIWTHLAVKNEKFVEYIEEQIKNGTEEEKEAVVAAPAKKTTKKATKPKKSTKAADADGVPTEDAEPAPAKKTSKKKKAVAVTEPIADDQTNNLADVDGATERTVDQVSNLTEDIEDLDDDVEAKPKQKSTTKKSTTKTSTKKAVSKKPVVSDE